MSNRRVPGIEAYPDLAARFDLRLGQVVDKCGGCKVRELINTFKKLVEDRQKRDNDFRKR